VKTFLNTLLLVIAIGMVTGPVRADNEGGGRNAAETFATLPDGVRFPEGITANPRTGEIYVATFDFGSPNKLLRFSRNGHLQVQRDFGATPLLGLAFHRAQNKVYIANVGNLAGAGAAYMTGQVLHPNGGEIING
jgi:DNA-binding beta-propeller fold protein YncE